MRKDLAICHVEYSPRHKSWMYPTRYRSSSWFVRLGNQSWSMSCLSDHPHVDWRKDCEWSWRVYLYGKRKQQSLWEMFYRQNLKKREDESQLLWWRRMLIVGRRECIGCWIATGSSRCKCEWIGGRCWSHRCHGWIRKRIRRSKAGIRWCVQIRIVEMTWMRMKLIVIDVGERRGRVRYIRCTTRRDNARWRCLIVFTRAWFASFRWFRRRIDIRTLAFHSSLVIIIDVSFDRFGISRNPRRTCWSVTGRFLLSCRVTIVLSETFGELEEEKQTMFVVRHECLSCRLTGLLSIFKRVT